MRLLTITRTLVVLICLSTVPPTIAQEITIDHAQGTTVLPVKPLKIFTYDPASLDILDALDIEISGVPRSNIPSYLEKYKNEKYLKIGTLFQPDYETVQAEKPDLIIVASRSASAYKDLSAIAPTIDLTVPQDHFIAGVEKNVRTLGHIFNKDAEAAKLIAKLNASTVKIKEESHNVGNALIIMTNGGKITAYGTGSRFGWVHDDLGIKPTVADLNTATHGEAISFEFLLKADPDWLFVLDRDSVVGNNAASARQTLNNELVAATNAARKNHIVYVDTERWYLVGGGISALQASIDALAKILSR